MHATTLKPNRSVSVVIVVLFLALSGLAACGRTASQAPSPATGLPHTIIGTDEGTRALQRLHAPSTYAPDEGNRALQRLHAPSTTTCDVNDDGCRALQRVHAASSQSGAPVVIIGGTHHLTTRLHISER